MFTECPECQTTFRLTAEDLRRAQGRVRCGACHAVFNALESLAEEPEAAPPPAPTETASTLRPRWLIDSADNPPGDLDPDLDTYEKTAYLPDGEVAFDYEFDDDADDEGAILYIDDDQRTASNADAIEPRTDPEPAAAPDADATGAAGAETAALASEDAEWRLDADDADDFGTTLPDFDETIWERIPGVAAAAPPDGADVALPDAAAGAPPDTTPETSGAELAANANATDDPFADDPFTDAAPDAATEHETALEVWVAEGGSTQDAAAAPVESAPADAGADFVAADDADADADSDEYEYEYEYEYGYDEDEDEDEFDAEPADVDKTRRDATEDPLEFDVPAENWNQFFGPVAATAQPVVWEPPAPAADDAATAAADDASAAGGPSWQGEDAAAAEGGGRSWLRLTGGLLLLLLFATQLLHYNRDKLAAHPEYGPWIRSAYAAVNQPLYPAWPLQNNYEIRGSEAVVGESGQDVMDIRAQIAAVGEHVTGLPRLRVVLRDRWSNPVAASDFGPREYALPTDLPRDGLLQPGDVVPARVSIADPGAGVQGFELELCLPRRNTGLECTDQPFK